MSENYPSEFTEAQVESSRIVVNEVVSEAFRKAFREAFNANFPVGSRDAVNRIDEISSSENLTGDFSGSDSH